MSNNNLNVWNRLCRPPRDTLKAIKGGRLKGMTDISPQWRYKIMTKEFGACGIGWYFDIIDIWTDICSDNQVVQGVSINLYINKDGEWSKPISGVGGSKLVDKETRGLYTNDEAVKMALTDALGTAMKLLGVAADIYMGLYDGSKYKDESDEKPFTKEPEPVGKKEVKMNLTFLQKMRVAKGMLRELTADDNLYYITLEEKGYKKSNQVEKKNQEEMLTTFRNLVAETETLAQEMK